MNNTQSNEKISVSLYDIVFILKKKILLIITSTILIAFISFFYYSFVVTPQYSSTTKIYVIGSDTITSISDLQIGSSLTQDYIQLIQSRPVIQTVIDNLDLSYTYDTLLSNISVENPTDTRMLNITVTDSDPNLAKKIADNVASVSITKIHEIMLAEEPQIVEEGVVNTEQISPNVGRSVVVTTIAGTLIVIVLIILGYLLDDTLKSDEDVELRLDLSTLAEIPLEEKYTPVFKDERLQFLNKPLESLRKELKRICKKLPLVRSINFRHLAKKLLRR